MEENNKLWKGNSPLSLLIYYLAGLALLALPCANLQAGPFVGGQGSVAVHRIEQAERAHASEFKRAGS